MITKASEARTEVIENNHTNSSQTSNDNHHIVIKKAVQSNADSQNTQSQFRRDNFLNQFSAASILFSAEQTVKNVRSFKCTYVVSNLMYGTDFCGIDVGKQFNYPRNRKGHLP